MACLYGIRCPIEETSTRHSRPCSRYRTCSCRSSSRGSLRIRRTTTYSRTSRWSYRVCSGCSNRQLLNKYIRIRILGWISQASCSIGLRHSRDKRAPICTTWFKNTSPSKALICQTRPWPNSWVPRTWSVRSTTPRNPSLTSSSRTTSQMSSTLTSYGRSSGVTSPYWPIHVSI